MSFNGTLLYVSNSNSNWTAFPMKYVAAESYSVLMSGQDLDSGRNANGYLVRNSLDNPLPKVEFDTKNMMTNKEFATMMNYFRSRYVNTSEKALWVKAYIPEIDDYMSQKCYLPDITPTIYLVDKDKSIIYYTSTRIALIGYGENK